MTEQARSGVTSLSTFCITEDSVFSQPWQLTAPTQDTASTQVHIQYQTHFSFLNFYKL